MTAKRRAPDGSLKLQVVKIITGQGLAVSQLCRNLNLVDPIQRWVQRYESDHRGKPRWVSR